MAKLPEYQNRGVRTAGVPSLRVGAVALRAPSRQSLASAMAAQQSLIDTIDRMGAELFKEAAKDQYEKGLQYGLENAPSAEQIQDAVNAGANVKDLFLVSNTFFGQGAIKAQAALAAVELHAKGEQVVADVLTQIDNGEINDLDQVKARIKGATEGMAKGLDTVAPEEALRLRASMATLGNAAVVKASKAIVAKQKEEAKLRIEASMQDAPKIIEALIARGDAIDPATGKKVTVDMQLDVYRAQLFRSLAAIGDPTYARTTMDRFNKMREDSARQAVTRYLTQNHAGEPWAVLKALRSGNAGQMSSVYRGLDEDAKEKVRVDYMQEVARMDVLSRKGEADRKRSLGRSYGADLVGALTLPDGPEKDAALRGLAVKYAEIVPPSELRNLIDPRERRAQPNYAAEQQVSIYVHEQGITDPRALSSVPGWDALSDSQRAKITNQTINEDERRHARWMRMRAGIPEGQNFMLSATDQRAILKQRIDMLNEDGKQASKLANDGIIDYAWVRDYIDKHLNSGKDDNKVEEARKSLEALNVGENVSEADIRARYPRGQAEDIIRKQRIVKGQQ